MPLWARKIKAAVAKFKGTLWRLHRKIAWAEKCCWGRGLIFCFLATTNARRDESIWQSRVSALCVHMHNKHEWKTNTTWLCGGPSVCRLSRAHLNNIVIDFSGADGIYICRANIIFFARASTWGTGSCAVYQSELMNIASVIVLQHIVLGRM